VRKTVWRIIWREEGFVWRTDRTAEGFVGGLWREEGFVWRTDRRAEGFVGGLWRVARQSHYRPTDKTGTVGVLKG
jgi:hypothetical protein